MQDILQSLMVNQMMAAIAAEYIYKLVVGHRLTTFQTVVDLNTLAMRSTPITERNLRDVAERARMTADERADRLRKRLAKFKRELPVLRKFLVQAEQEGRDDYAAKLRKQIAYREQILATEEER